MIRHYMLAGAFAIVLGLAAAWVTRASLHGRQPAMPGTPGSGAGQRPAQPEMPIRASRWQAGTTTETASVPAPTVADTTGPLDRDPRGPGYDAARLFNMHIGDTRGIFDAEPRLEAWAKQREADIVESALTDLKHADPAVQMDRDRLTIRDPLGIPAEAASELDDYAGPIDVPLTWDPE